MAREAARPPVGPAPDDRCARLRRRAAEAMRAGDWELAAAWEERALLLEHRLAQLADRPAAWGRTGP